MTTQEIIDGLTNILNYCRYHENAPALREAIRILREMDKTEDDGESAQQEIIYCKECSRYSNGYCHHPETYSIYVDANHFCGYAERMGNE